MTLPGAPPMARRHEFHQALVDFLEDVADGATVYSRKELFERFAQYWDAPQSLSAVITDLHRGYGFYSRLLGDQYRMEKVDMAMYKVYREGADPIRSSHLAEGDLVEVVEILNDTAYIVRDIDDIQYVIAIRRIT